LLVACTWERRVEADGTGRVLPDGAADLVWADDARLFVAGPDTGPVTFEMRSGSEMIGLRFRPGVAGGALGIPASELRDARAPLEALWGEQARELAELLAGAPDAARRRALLEEALLRRLPELEPPNPLVVEAVRRLGRPASRVSALSEVLFVSERQLRRVFADAVGYGPKTLDRVLRFQRFLSRGPAVENGDEKLAGVAAELGYADQAHLARDVNRLSGLSPRRLVELWSP
jgi:AraC-like DNA-binding protein